jgi:hypothetical protein
MFRKALLSGLMIITGGLSTALGGGMAIAAAPAQACAVTSVIEITHFAFNPPAIPPGQSATATLTAQNCTNQAQQTSEIWSGRFTGPSGGIPPGCPAIDPISIGVNFPPHGAVSKSVTYAVPLSCTATQLIVTANIDGDNGMLLAHGTAVLEIVSATG